MFNLFKRKPKLKPHTYIMKNHTGWGNAINWTAWPRLQVHGHLHRIPHKGDLLIAEFNNGTKVLQFKFKSVEACRDPSDMFFASVKYVKGLEDN